LKNVLGLSIKFPVIEKNGLIKTCAAETPVLAELALTECEIVKLRANYSALMRGRCTRQVLTICFNY
jgi:hypothetical protein